MLHWPIVSDGGGGGGGLRSASRTIEQKNLEPKRRRRKICGSNFFSFFVFLLIRPELAQATLRSTKTEWIYF